MALPSTVKLLSGRFVYISAKYSTKSFADQIYQRDSSSTLFKSLHLCTPTSGGLIQHRNVSRSSATRNETVDLDATSIGTQTRQKSEKEVLRDSIALPTVKPTQAELLHDFKYALVTSLDQNLIEERFKVASEEERPLVLLCGWAGANHKNLSKYSDIYNRAGCLTLGYNLPSRFVFSQTSEIPHISKELLKVIEEEKLIDRPIFFHLMSDTGKMDNCIDNSLYRLFV